jgi:hypothetical protein
MNIGIGTVIYLVKDNAKAKGFFRQLFGVEPYADAPEYVGFKVNNQEIGLDPKATRKG